MHHTTTTNGQISQTNSDQTAKIIGGTVVQPPDRYPWMTLLWHNRPDGSLQDWTCGGTLIASNVVLSAAHCGGNIGTVQVGRYDISDTNDAYESFTVLHSILHPMYDKDTLDNDYMLLILNEHSTVTPATLDDGNTKLSNGQDLISMGFGATNTKNPVYSDLLLEVTVDLVTQSNCRSAYGVSAITDNMLCAWRKDKDTCWGDSGGPLITTSDVLVAVVSWGYECADKDYPGVYARVSSVYDWILSQLCVYSPVYMGTCAPTTSPVPTEMPGTASPTMDCMDVTNWLDSYGDNCAWYAKDVGEDDYWYDEADTRCTYWGDCCKNLGHTAMTACCVCGGGMERAPFISPMKSPVTPQPTYSPTTEYTDSVQLVSPADGQNVQCGNMFDVYAKLKITIQNLAIHTYTAQVQEQVSVYTKFGTFVGYEGTAQAYFWILQGTYSIESRGFGSYTPLGDAFEPLVLQAGETWGFYITLHSENMVYSMGTDVGSIFIQDAGLTIHEGIGLAYPFGKMYMPRKWNGVIRFLTSPTADPTPSPTSKPSARPSVQPTAMPSSVPTRLPSTRPSAQPSAIPSNIPSQHPSAGPSTQPIAIPSGAPSHHPITAPSNFPSSRPSKSPTVTPSDVSSLFPTKFPTSHPSSAPSKLSSSGPSGELTLHPSQLPSDVHSDKPSVLPTEVGRTHEPSKKLSSPPSSYPTTIPTNHPSEGGIVVEVGSTDAPSLSPLNQPSPNPSTALIDEPSLSPTSPPLAMLELQSTFEGSLTYQGNMFDVVAAKNMFIEALDIHTSAEASTVVEIYTRNGSHKNRERRPGAWTLLSETNLNALGKGIPTHLVLSSPIAVNAGATVAIFVNVKDVSSNTLVSSSMNSMKTFQTFADNDDLTLRVGKEYLCYS